MSFNLIQSKWPIHSPLDDLFQNGVIKHSVPIMVLGKRHLPDDVAAKTHSVHLTTPIGNRQAWDTSFASPSKGQSVQEQHSLQEQDLVLLCDCEYAGPQCTAPSLHTV